MANQPMVTDSSGNGGQSQGAGAFRLSPSSPITEQPSVNVSMERTRSHNGGSDRKRNRRAMADDGALDDIMGQITSKLTTLSTKESSTEEDSIGAFIDVLNCNRSEAQFYLESSAWNVETAVMLWLENNPVNTRSSSYLPTLAVPTHAYYTAMGPYFDSQAMGGSSSGFNRPRGAPMYRSREVIIEGLPAGWSARVSKHSGQVYFVEQGTGKTQYNVPAGFADRDPERVIDLTQGVIDLTRASNGNGHSGSSGREEEMVDDLDDSMEQDAPDSPVAGPPNSIDPRNSRPVAHRSGVKSGASAYDSGTEGRFCSAMDEYNGYSDASDASSNKAVWDDGSGYSLNDGAYSVSSTTNSTNDSPVFSSMHGRGAGSVASTFLSGTNSMLTSSSTASDGLNPNTSAAQNHNNTQYFTHNYSNNTSQSGSQHSGNHSGQHSGSSLEGPMTQDSTPTPLDSQLYPPHSNNNNGSTGPNSGIAMLGPAETEHSSDYFLGSFTPASSQHSSSNDLS